MPHCACPHGVCCCPDMPAVIWLACSKFGGPDPSACDGCSSAAARHSSPAPAASLCFPCHNCLAALRCYSAELFDRRFTANSHEHLEKLFTIESQEVTRALAGARATGWGLRGSLPLLVSACAHSAAAPSMAMVAVASNLSRTCCCSRHSRPWALPPPCSNLLCGLRAASVRDRAGIWRWQGRAMRRPCHLRG